MAAVLEEKAHTGVLEIPGKPDITWTADDDAQVEAARAAFAATMTETKGAAYDQAGAVIREFDPAADRIRMFGQMAGG